MDERELRKQYNVIDMMTTMHSVLFDKYRRRYQALDLLIFASSVVVLSMTFSDKDFLLQFGLGGEKGQLVVGGASLAIFILSIFSLIVDWKGKYAQHKEAFNALVGLKSDWRAFMAKIGDSSDSVRAEFSQNTSLRVGSLIDIPDSKFNKLKAVHFRKIAVSKLISENPGCSRLVAWCKVYVSASYNAVTCSRKED